MKDDTVRLATRRRLPLFSLLLTTGASGRHRHASAALVFAKHARPRWRERRLTLVSHNRERGGGDKSSGAEDAVASGPQDKRKA